MQTLRWMLAACRRLQEESNEFGGTFICNGIERIIRMLVQVGARGGRGGWGGAGAGGAGAVGGCGVVQLQGDAAPACAGR